MKNISLSVPLSPAYTSALCNLSATQAKLELPLVDGNHSIESAAKVIGSLSNKKSSVIEAFLTIWYEFDSENRTIKFCSSDLVSDKSLRLTSVLNDENERCEHRCYEEAPYLGERNLDWNYCTPITPDLKTLMHQTIRAANALIIEEAKKADLNVIVLTPVPEIPSELFDKLYIVYDEDGFMDFYDPDKAYDDNHRIYHIFSKWGGEITLSKGENFATSFSHTCGSKDMASYLVRSVGEKIYPVNRNEKPRYTVLHDPLRWSSNKSLELPQQ